MSDVNELIKRAEEALKELPPTPWRKEYSKGAWCIVDSNNQSVVYDIDDTPEEIADFIEHSPVLIRGLVDALKEAETNLDAALMREQRTVEEMETWMDRALKAGWDK